MLMALRWLIQDHFTMGDWLLTALLLG
jgi:hypothetical protein